MKQSRQEARGANSRQMVELPVGSVLLLRAQAPRLLTEQWEKHDFKMYHWSVTSNKYNADTYTTCNASALKMNVPFQSKVMRTGAAFWDLTKSY